MNYIRAMIIRVVLVAVPALAAVGLVLLLNALNASGGIVVVAYTAVAAGLGTAIGRALDRLPGGVPRHEEDIAPDRHRN